VPAEVFIDPFCLCEISTADLTDLIVPSGDKDLLMTRRTSVKETVCAFFATPRLTALADKFSAPSAFTTLPCKHRPQQIGIE
jgi:hypothetical protein